MNIVIVEDEPKIRDGLVNIISKNTLHRVVATAENAEAGYIAVKEYDPELVIADIQMPGETGLNMLQRLRGEGYMGDAVILTGYSEFEYAREAIRVNAIEYLLKPITVDDLQQCFDKIEARRSEESAERYTAEQGLELLLTSDNIEKGRILGFLQKKLKIERRKQIAIFLVKPRSLDNETHSWLGNSLKQYMEMLCVDHYYVIRPGLQYGVALLVMDTERNKLLEKSFQSFVMPRLTREIQCVCSCTRFCDLERLQITINQLKGLLIYSLLCDKNTVITEELVTQINCGELEYPVKLELNLKQAVYNSDEMKIRNAAEEFKNLIFSSEYKPVYIIEYSAKFLLSACTAARECNKDFGDKLIYNNYIKSVIDSTSKEELLDNIDCVIEAVISRDNACSETQNLIVLKAVNYIRENYPKEITLTQLAELLNVTPEYLSSLFYKEMRVNFVTFLKNFRISHAKRLIAENRHKIHEIAQMVGFSDPKYFNRVFKSVCGISPSEYKKNI